MSKSENEGERLTRIDILYLRNYKSFRESNRKHDSGDCVRFYLEYAPYGSLRDLMDRYRAFHRYLLEVFLWHSFNALARAVLELEELQRPNGEEYIIHCDLKPDNILLGYEKNTYTDRTGGLLDTDEYPTLKLAGFGLSLKLSPHRLAHGQRTNWAWRGTKFYETPVSDGALRIRFVLTQSIGTGPTRSDSIKPRS